MDDLVTQAAAARFLSVHPSTLIYWRKTGEGPPWLAVGPKLIRYRKSDLAEWLNSRVVDPAKAV